MVQLFISIFSFLREKNQSKFQNVIIFKVPEFKLWVGLGLDLGKDGYFGIPFDYFGDEQ